MNDCPHRYEPQRNSARPRAMIRCLLQSEYLGWKHGVGIAMCDDCAADPQHGRTLKQESRRRSVRLRVLRFVGVNHDWHSKGVGSKTHEEIIARAIGDGFVTAEETEASLVVGVQHGMSGNRAVVLRSAAIAAKELLA